MSYGRVGWVRRAVLRVRAAPMHLPFLSQPALPEMLLKIAAAPKHLGAETGVLAVLHTWGQNLLHHPLEGL